MSFFCLQFPPKNERKQVNLRLHSSKIEFVRPFFGGNVGLKKSFRHCLIFRGGGPEFGRSVNPIQTRGRIIPLTLLPAPPDSKTYLHICTTRVNAQLSRASKPFLEQEGGKFRQSLTRTNATSRHQILYCYQVSNSKRKIQIYG